MRLVHSIATVFIALVFVIALFGGAACLMWFAWGGGPREAFILGCLGLPLCCVAGAVGNMLEAKP